MVVLMADPRVPPPPPPTSFGNFTSIVSHVGEVMSYLIIAPY